MSAPDAPDRDPRPAIEKSRTYLNCTWAERRTFVSGPLWLVGWRSRLYCLALSDQAQRPVEVQPERCASCPFWQARAELSRAPGDLP